MKKTLFSLALIAPAALALDGITFDHEDWTLSCDNTGTCRAAGYQAGHDEPVSLLLTRQAGADAAVRAELQIIPDIRDGKLLDTKATLSLNGKALGTFTFPADNAVVQLDDQQTAAILAALPQKKAEIVVTAGERKMMLSDKGASAVLLKMDEFQQRIDTPSALIKPGKSDKAVLAAQTVPHSRSAPAASGEPRTIAAGSAEYATLMQHFARDLGAEGECRHEDGSAPAFTLYPLGGGRLLSETPCWRGAYNEGNLYAVLSEDLGNILQTVPGTALYQFDRQKNLLLGTYKARGAGDCGEDESWVYDGEQFVQSSVIDWGLCKGFNGGAWQLPLKVSEVIPAP